MGIQALSQTQSTDPTNPVKKALTHNNEGFLSFLTEWFLYHICNVAKLGSASELNQSIRLLSNNLKKHGSSLEANNPAYIQFHRAWDNRVARVRTQHKDFDSKIKTVSTKALKTDVIHHSLGKNAEKIISKKQLQSRVSQDPSKGIAWGNIAAAAATVGIGALFAYGAYTTLPFVNSWLGSGGASTTVTGVPTLPLKKIADRATTLADATLSSLPTTYVNSSTIIPGFSLEDRWKALTLFKALPPTKTVHSQSFFSDWPNIGVEGALAIGAMLVLGVKRLHATCSEKNNGHIVLPTGAPIAGHEPEVNKAPQNEVGADPKVEAPEIAGHEPKVNTAPQNEVGADPLVDAPENAGQGPKVNKAPPNQKHHVSRKEKRARWTTIDKIQCEKNELNERENLLDQHKTSLEKIVQQMWLHVFDRFKDDLRITSEFNYSLIQSLKNTERLDTIKILYHRYLVVFGTKIDNPFNQADSAKKIEKLWFFKKTLPPIEQQNKLTTLLWELHQQIQKLPAPPTESFLTEIKSLNTR